MDDLDGARREDRRTRSSSFWSTTSTRTSGSSCAATDSRKRGEFVRSRPTVATTRSNDGSSCGTRRRLRHVVPTAPLVSVLLAVHDGEPFVRTALRASCGQTVADLELIVVDDASTDATRRDARGRRRPARYGCSATTSSSGSRVRSTAASTTRAGVMSRAWTPTTRPFPPGSSAPPACWSHDGAARARRRRRPRHRRARTPGRAAPA